MSCRCLLHGVFLLVLGCGSQPPSPAPVQPQANVHQLHSSDPARATPETARSVDASSAVTSAVAAERSADPTGKQTASGGGRLPRQEVFFLGSRGLGRRFCIIADNSLSIKPAQFTQIRGEILSTLRSLDPESHFFVMFFSDKPYPMPGGTWQPGGGELQGVRDWMDRQKRVLGTFPVPAFKRAFQLQPRPDVIFFMTDGQFATTAPDQITALNQQEPRTVINTILFSSPPPPSSSPKKAATLAARVERARKQLELVATRNGGTVRVFTAVEAK